MTFRILSSALVLAGLMAAATPAMAERQMEEMSTAVLRTIDKISARTQTFEVPVDKTVKFGNSLFIKLRACRKSSPLELPESAAFLQIWEKKADDDESKWVFSGWMFASNPSLSAMDHPVYDVWVIECKNATTSAKSSDFTSEQAPEGKPEEGEAFDPTKLESVAPTAAKPKAVPADEKPTEEQTEEPATAEPEAEPIDPGGD